MRAVSHIIAATLLLHGWDCAAKDYLSPQHTFALRVDERGARIIRTSDAKSLYTVAKPEDMAEDDGWAFTEAKWEGLTVVVCGRWGNHHKYSTLAVFRMSDYEDNATVEELDLYTPFTELLQKDADRERDASYATAEAFFIYGGQLRVKYRRTGTGSAQWSHDEDDDFYYCDFDVAPQHPVKASALRRVRTTEIPLR